MAIPQLRFKADDGTDFPLWQQKRFGDIMTCYSGGTPLASVKSYYGGTIPFLKSGEIHLDKTSSTLTDLGLANSSAKMISKGDLIYALYGATSGDVDIAKLDAAINQAILCIRPHNDDRVYLKHWLTFKRNSIISKYLQGGQGNLSAEIIKSLIVPIPILDEQRKIAALLSNVDDVIAKQQAEVAAWEQRKKGVAQRLFSQEVRFKADDGSAFPDWEQQLFGNIGYVAMCKRVYKRQTSASGDVPFFKIKTFGGTPDAYISRKLFEELKSKFSYPKQGTPLISASGTIGRVVAFDGADAYFQDSNIVWLEHDDTVLDSFLHQLYHVVKWQSAEALENDHGLTSHFFCDPGLLFLLFITN